jgi:hypothetical protein
MLYPLSYEGWTFAQISENNSARKSSFSLRHVVSRFSAATFGAKQR